MDFNCQRCGKCCKEIGIAWSELDTHGVASYLDVPLTNFLADYGYVINTYSGEIEHTEFGVTPCPFLAYEKNNAMCKIYPVRPWICKGYPGPGVNCRGGQKRP